jgi:hypothetical protein
MNSRASLRRVIKESAGQDINTCQMCFDCDIRFPDDLDIPLGSLVQMALLDDDEVLECRTLWSDTILEAAHGACKRGLDLPAVILALRQESTRRFGKEKTC